MVFIKFVFRFGGEWEWASWLKPPPPRFHPCVLEYSDCVTGFWVMFCPLRLGYIFCLFSVLCRDLHCTDSYYYNNNNNNYCKKSKGTAVPLQAWTGPEGSRRLRFTVFQDSRHMKLVRSALRTGRLYPQEIFLVLIC